MAAHHSSRKVRTYQSLSRLNRAFATITRHCWFIERNGFVPIVQMRTYANLARELQAQINYLVTGELHDLEEEDAYRYGTTRAKRDHHLNPQRTPLGKRER